MYMPRRRCFLLTRSGWRKPIHEELINLQGKVLKKVILNTTYEKFITLNNVLHIGSIRKNLVFGLLLSKNSFKMVFESDKFILSKSDIFIDKRYHYDDFLKINVMTIVTIDENNNKIVSSSYLF
jgi:hypothetical protein